MHSCRLWLVPWQQGSLLVYVFVNRADRRQCRLWPCHCSSRRQSLWNAPCHCNAATAQQQHAAALHISLRCNIKHCMCTNLWCMCCLWLIPGTCAVPTCRQPRTTVRSTTPGTMNMASTCSAPAAAVSAAAADAGTGVSIKVSCCTNAKQCGPAASSQAAGPPGPCRPAHVDVAPVCTHSHPYLFTAAA
jgi:hypothetical protein